MRKGRRKPKVVWLPADINNRLGTAPVAATSGQDSQTIIHIFTGNPLGAVPITEEIPIVKDFTQANELLKVETSLADIEQSGYRLRRIVGKLSFAALQNSAVGVADASIFHVTAGFIIRRIDDAGNSFASVGAAGLDISTVTFNNIADPWIWRRSWDLSDNSAAAAALDPNVLAYAPSNVRDYAGGNSDGPHVDQKTARIVGPEERLFLSVTVEGINGSAQGEPGALVMIGDLRILASMRSNTGNRRNASR